MAERAVLEENVPHSVSSLPLVEAYYAAGLTKKGDEISSKVIEDYLQQLDWFFRLKPELMMNSLPDIQNALLIVTEALKLSNSNSDALKGKYDAQLASYQNTLLGIIKLLREP